MHSLTQDHSCCGGVRKGFGRRLQTAVEWLLPGAALLLIPKCPLCIVAYVAVFSGIGLSIPAASGIRIGLLVMSSAALVYLAARSLLSSSKLQHDAVSMRGRI